MRTFIVFDQITAEIIEQLNGIKLVGAVSIHAPSELENILSQFKAGDTLIVEGVHLFNGVSELYYTLCLISSLFNGHFISLKQRKLKLDSNGNNEELLNAIGMGVKLEEKYLNMAESDADMQSIKVLKRLCIRIIKDGFSK